MEDQSKTVWKQAIQYGSIIGIILIVFSLVLYILDVNTFEEKWLSWVSYGIVFIGITFAMLNYRNQVLGGAISYQKSFSVGFTSALVAGIISGIFMVIFMIFLGDEFEQLAIDNSEQEVLKRNPNATDEEFAMAEKLTKIFLNPPILGVLVVIGTAFWGAIYSLIASIFIKKETAAEQGV